MIRIIGLTVVSMLAVMGACGSDVEKAEESDKAEKPEVSNDSMPSNEELNVISHVDSSIINSEHPAEMTFKDTIYDFGTIAHGEVVTHEFEFTNTGESPLIILDAKSTCGCTVPSYPKEVIKPGESGSITVRFDSNNKKGLEISKRVSISANTYPNTINSVYITGKVGNYE